MRARSTRPDPRREGLTLIEVLIVLVIIAVAMSGVSFAFGAVTRAELRRSCMRIAAASHFAYSRAVSRGKTYRILLDFEQNKISIEEAEGTVNLARAADERRRATEAGSDHVGEERAAVDPWVAARARLENTLHPTLGASPFGCVRNLDGECSKSFQPQDIGGGIRFVKLFVPHEPEPRTQGRGALYFFPNGMTERAVVQLADRSDRIYSVEIHPLTGAVRVISEPYEPRSLTDDSTDAQRSEVEDD